MSEDASGIIDYDRLASAVADGFRTGLARGLATSDKRHESDGADKGDDQSGHD